MIAAYEIINIATGNTLGGFGADERDRAVELWRSLDQDRYAIVSFDSNGWALSAAPIEDWET